MHFNMLEAKTQLSKLVEAALRGEEVVIANRGRPMVKLVPTEPAKPKRRWGSLESLWTDAEIDAAFTPEADAQAAADLMNNINRRSLRVMEPGTSYIAAKPKTRKERPASKRPASKRP